MSDQPMRIAVDSGSIEDERRGKRNSVLAIVGICAVIWAGWYFTIGQLLKSPKSVTDTPEYRQRVLDAELAGAFELGVMYGYDEAGAVGTTNWTRVFKDVARDHPGAWAKYHGGAQ